MIILIMTTHNAEVNIHVSKNRRPGSSNDNTNHDNSQCRGQYTCKQEHQVWHQTKQGVRDGINSIVSMSGLISNYHTCVYRLLEL